MNPKTKAKIVRALRNYPYRRRVRFVLARKSRDGGMCYCAEGVILQALGFKPVPVPGENCCSMVNRKIDIKVDGFMTVDNCKELEIPRRGTLSVNAGGKVRPVALHSLNDGSAPVSRPYTLRMIADLIEAQW